jgi:hypothetical protein
LKEKPNRTLITKTSRKVGTVGEKIVIRKLSDLPPLMIADHRSIAVLAAYPSNEIDLNDIPQLREENGKMRFEASIIAP